MVYWQPVPGHTDHCSTLGKVLGHYRVYKCSFCFERVFFFLFRCDTTAFTGDKLESVLLTTLAQSCLGPDCSAVNNHCLFCTVTRGFTLSETSSLARKSRASRRDLVRSSSPQRISGKNPSAICRSRVILTATVILHGPRASSAATSATPAPSPT